MTCSVHYSETLYILHYISCKLYIYDTKCLLPKPSTINCDLWSWFENMWMWEIIQNFDLPNLNSWWLAWNWLPAAAVEQKAETGKYTKIYKPTPNTPNAGIVIQYQSEPTKSIYYNLDIYYLLSILATVQWAATKHWNAFQWKWSEWQNGN